MPITENQNHFGAWLIVGELFDCIGSDARPWSQAKAGQPRRLRQRSVPKPGPFARVPVRLATGTTRAA